jgi:hypothetical protein
VTRLERGAARGGGRSSAVERAFARARVGKRRGRESAKRSPTEEAPTRRRTRPVYEDQSAALDRNDGLFAS